MKSNNQKYELGILSLYYEKRKKKKENTWWTENLVYKNVTQIYKS